MKNRMMRWGLLLSGLTCVLLLGGGCGGFGGLGLGGIIAALAALLLLTGNLNLGT